MSLPEPSYSQALGEWMAEEADNVRDMGSRVEEVLSQNPRDHHYAASKMAAALDGVVQVLTFVGWSEDEMIELLHDAHERALRSKQSLAREFERSRS